MWTRTWCLMLLIAAAGCQGNESASSLSPQRPRRTPRPAAQHPPPPVRTSPFRNAQAGVAYVGNNACRECHPDEFASYQQTTHSEALSTVDIAREPPDGEFTHELSGRSYRVYREGEQLRHREFIRAAGGDGEEEEIVLADHPMRYLIGSGNHSRSYLVEIDGFMFESPVTWYAAREAWGMSPGYQDDPMQLGFSREIRHDCVVCHVGRVETVDRSPQRLRILEQPITCERCHGPGALHVQHHEEGGVGGAEFDDTIVHPARLPRDRQEAICGQCHLATLAEANVRGRSIADFRPSLHLSDFLVRFQVETEPGAMTVVGHMEQMRASRCYQMSPEMTCTTCHDPHGGAQAKAGRASCLQCHDPHACGMDHELRLRQSAGDDCTVCHMPKSPTDIPHFVFRHHRIAVHREPPPSEEAPIQGGEKLVAIDDLGHLPEVERNRCLGLAYVKLAEEAEVRDATFFYQRAVALLEKVRAEGVRDAEVDVALARIYLRAKDMRLAVDSARSAMLGGSPRDTIERDVAGVLSRAYANQQRYAQAIPFVEQLTRFGYHANDHLLLSVCRQRAGDLAGALQAVRQALKIEPHRAELHDSAAELYRRLGQEEDAQWHLERGRRLRQYLPPPPGAP